MIRDRLGLKRKVMGLLFSLIIHAVFIYLGMTLVSPVKVYIYKKKIIDVVIVPPEKLFFPQINEYSTSINDFSLGPEGVGLKEDYRLAYQRTKPEKERINDDIQTKATVTRRTFKPDLTSGFRLNSLIKSRLSLSLSDKLNLSLNPEKIKKRLGESGKQEKKKALNLLKYLYPGFSNNFYAKVRRQSRGPKTGVFPLKRTAAFLKQGYDITPWAETIVGRIQKNWLITSHQKITQKSQVGITVTVEKNGELISIKVVNPSPEQSFEQDALKAINLSLPFPQLPDDFPEKMIQIYLVFQCHD